MLVSIAFPAGGGANVDALKARGGAIVDAPKSGEGAIFDAYHLDFIPSNIYDDFFLKYPL